MHLIDLTGLSAGPLPVAHLGRRHSIRRRLPVTCFASNDTKASSPSLSSSAVSVCLRIPYRVHFGQSLGVVGAGEVLGKWEGSKALPMKWTPGDYWEAELSVEAEAPTQLEYKYVVLNSNGQVSHWKPGPNYKLDLLASKGTKVRVVETWDDGPRHVEVDMQSDTTKATATASKTPGTAATGGGPATAVKDGSKGAASDQQGSNGAREDVETESNGRRATPRGSRATLQPATTVLQQEAQVAMSELKDVLGRQEEILKRVKDPTDMEIIMGDRLLAAANSKAVAMNRAVRAAEALPMLPPSTDSTGSSKKAASETDAQSDDEGSGSKAKSKRSSAKAAPK